MPRFVDENAGAKGGLRERKRRETFQRVTETGLSLFIANGYEATTLEAIASAAGISRRTFFYYFKSKDDILLSLQSGLVNALHAALKDEPLDESPLDAVRNALLKIFARYRSDEMIVIDRLMRSSETLRVRKQASYVQQEQELFAALCERWPDPGGVCPAPRSHGFYRSHASLDPCLEPGRRKAAGGEVPARSFLELESGNLNELESRTLMNADRAGRS